MVTSFYCTRCSSSINESLGNPVQTLLSFLASSFSSGRKRVSRCEVAAAYLSAMVLADWNLCSGQEKGRLGNRVMHASNMYHLYKKIHIHGYWIRLTTSLIVKLDEVPRLQISTVLLLSLRNITHFLRRGISVVSFTPHRRHVCVSNHNGYLGQYFQFWQTPFVNFDAFLRSLWRNFPWEYGPMCNWREEKTNTVHQARTYPTH